MCKVGHPKLRGVKMEYIDFEMKEFEKKVERLEMKDRYILGDLSICWTKKLLV